MDTITQNTYEVLELVEAGQISAEEVDYLISEGSINPYLFESVLDELIAENEYLYEAGKTDWKKVGKSAAIGGAALGGLHAYGQIHRSAGREQGHADYATYKGVYDRMDADDRSELEAKYHADELMKSMEKAKEAARPIKDKIIDAYHQGLEHGKALYHNAVEGAKSAYHSGVEHAGKAYGAAKEYAMEHPGIVGGAAAGAATAGAAGYAAYKYLKNKKAKAGK